MSWQLRWDTEALEDLTKLGHAEAKRIVKKIESHLIKDPLNLGKPLRSELSGLYRYRIGNYRVLYQVIHEEIVIEVVAIGHRKNVYDV